MTQNNSNGTAETAAPKVPSPIDVLHAEYVKAGSPKVDGKTAKTLVSAWEKAHAAREAAESAFEKAAKAESDAVAAIVRARGKGRLKLADGSQFIPMGRGDKVWLKREGGVDVETFG